MSSEMVTAMWQLALAAVFKMVITVFTFGIKVSGMKAMLFSPPPQEHTLLHHTSLTGVCVCAITSDVTLMGRAAIVKSAHSAQHISVIRDDLCLVLLPPPPPQQIEGHRDMLTVGTCLT